MLRAYKVFLATAYPQSEIVGTMKRLLACLALCASLSASAQDDNCTILGVQELSSLYSELSASIDSISNSIIAVADSLTSFNDVHTIVEYDLCHTSNTNRSTAMNSIKGCVNSKIAQGYTPFGSGWSIGPYGVWQALVKYADE